MPALMQRDQHDAEEAEWLLGMVRGWLRDVTSRLVPEKASTAIVRQYGDVHNEVVPALHGGAMHGNAGGHPVSHPMTRLDGMLGNFIFSSQGISVSKPQTGQAAAIPSKFSGTRPGCLAVWAFADVLHATPWSVAQLIVAITIAKIGPPKRRPSRLSAPGRGRVPR